MDESPSLLAYCLVRLQWSPERLAHEINKAYGTGTISSKAPYNWLKGARPRHHLPHMVAEILTNRLNESILANELWPRPSSRGRTPSCSGSVPSLDTPDSPATIADHVKAAVDWLVDDSSTQPTNVSGHHVPDIAIQMLSDRLRWMRGVDDISSTELAMQWTMQELRLARKLAMEYSYSERIGTYLHRLIAELAQLAGSLSADMGLRERSRSCLLTALTAARSARKRPLAAYIISRMAYRAIWEGYQEEGLRLIRIAQKGALGSRAGCNT